MTKIYYLHFNGIPFYIGKSINFISRLYSHRKTYGNNVEYYILDEVEDNEWLFWERFYISQFKNWGFNLTNQNNGGGGSTKCSESKKTTISKLKEKPIIQYDLDGNFVKEYKSIKSCSETLGIYETSIVRNLKGKYNSSNGFQFKYKSENYPLKIEKSYHKNNVLLLRYKDGIFIDEWRSGKIASEILGIKRQSISNNISGLTKTCNGFTWKIKNN